jgi:predicted ester cyclase
MSDQSSNRPLAGKAVTYKALGGPEVIEIVERTVRAPAAGEVRIEVKAAAVNPTDILFRDPGFGDQFGGDTFPIVPGMDAAGIICRTGRGISAVVPGGPEVGPGARRKLYQMFLQAIPDARGQVVDVVAEGDKVVLVDRFGGTHRGEFFGSPGTGNHIEWTAIHIYTIRDGKILEDAVMTDSLAIMQQIGLARKAWPATKQAEKY